MYINHVALYTKKLEKIKEFYEKYFNAKAGGLYYNEKTGLKTYFLYFENKTRLEIMSKPNVECLNNDLEHNGYIHIAFSVGSKENVDKLTSKLKCDGFDIISEPRVTGDGYYESSVKDLDGNIIEITV